LRIRPSPRREARALRLDVPNKLLATADEVIE
jgi:hypothetical protein